MDRLHVAVAIAFRYEHVKRLPGAIQKQQRTRQRWVLRQVTAER
jgi:hypothetical protein